MAIFKIAFNLHLIRLSLTLQHCKSIVYVDGKGMVAPLAKVSGSQTGTCPIYSVQCLYS